MGFESPDARQKVVLEFLYGGSFDPVHLGHVNVVNHLISTSRKMANSSMKFDCSIRIMPCAEPALKESTGASFLQRVEMLELAFSEPEQNQGLEPELDQNQMPCSVVIDRRENEREGKSYTLLSLQELKQEKQDRKILLVVGEDNLMTFSQWHQYEKIADYCHLIIVNRPGNKQPSLLKQMKDVGFFELKDLTELEIKPYGGYYCLSIEEMNVSSTEIRGRIQQGLSLDGYVPLSVQDYIGRCDLY